MAIRKCKCKCPTQDELHGKGMRVWNSTRKTADGLTFRCTSCLTEVYFGKGEDKKKKK